MTTDFEQLVNYLLCTQSENMLDKTKCSTTACNVYNFLCNGDSKMIYNNNLITTHPNLSELPEALYANSRDNTAYYLHFDHITGETSHYFIICQIRDRVVLFQSAVFEYSISDWLFPDKAKQEGKQLFDSQLLMLDSDDTVRYDITKQQLLYTFEERLQIIKRIESCKWSSIRNYTIQEFITEFIPLLESLEGVWSTQEEDLNAKRETYTQCFACYLKPGNLRGKLRQQAERLGMFKWTSDTMKWTPPPLDLYTSPVDSLLQSHAPIQDNTFQILRDNVSFQPPPV